MNDVTRLNPAEIQNLGKPALRAACTERAIKYAKLTVAQMRDAILQYEEQRVLRDAPADAVLKTARAPKGCSAIAASLTIGAEYPLQELANKHGVNPASLRTVLADHSNPRHSYFKRGLRFRVENGTVTRTA